MLNEDRNLNTIPVGALGIVALDSCKELGEKVDKYISDWRHSRQNEHNDTIAFSGYQRESYLVDM